jgi:inorganic pyrophosphatase
MAKTIPVVVETPQGARSKVEFDYGLGLLLLTKVLPAGLTFPLNFGSVPCTLADDDDPLDILLFMSDAVPGGTLVETRPIGVLEANQTEDGETVRNDRLFGVATESTEHRDLKTVKEIDGDRREEFERFFQAYNAECGKVFEGLGWFGPKRAWKLIERARRRYRPPKDAGQLPTRLSGFASALEDD